MLETAPNIQICASQVRPAPSPYRHRTAGRRAFFLTFSITQRDAPPRRGRCYVTGLVALVGEVPVDVAGDRRSRGDKITPDQARPMRQIRTFGQ
jgi:hypothetical protein